MSANLQLPAAAARWVDPARVAVVEQQWQTVPRRRDVEALVCELVSLVAHGSILDLGCGTARYAELLDGWTAYVGVDESEAMLKLAADRVGKITAERAGTLVHLHQSDARTFVAEGQFDLVLCLEVAPHYPDPLGFIASIMDQHEARHFLVSVEAHDRADVLFADFKVAGALGSRSVPRATMERFFGRLDVVALERVGSFWHPDAVDWFCLLRGNVDG